MSVNVASLLCSAHCGFAMMSPLLGNPDSVAAPCWPRWRLLASSSRRRRSFSSFSLTFSEGTQQENSLRSRIFSSLNLSFSLRMTSGGVGGPIGTEGATGGVGGGVGGVTVKGVENSRALGLKNPRPPSARDSNAGL